MKRIAFVSAIAVVSAVCFSCTKEKESPIEQITEDVSQTPSSHMVTIGLSLSPDTKTTHVTEEVDSKINVKTLWSEDDKILVTFTKDAVVKNEVFPLTSGAGETTAYFTKADSELENGDDYEVTYYSSKDYEHTFSWAKQDGTVANLPEWLTGYATYPAAPSLTSRLVHFHFVLSKAATPTEALSLANAYLYTSSDALKVDAENNTGAIKVTPASAFAYNTSGESSNANFYVSAKLAATAAGETFNVRLQNGDNYDGIQGYTLSWTANKDYTTDKVWKKASTAENMVYNSGLVGAANNTSGWFAGFKDFDIPAGARLQLSFVNYSSKANDYNNWSLLLKDLGWDLIAHLRADNAAYVEALEAWNNSSVFFSQNGNTTIDMTNFKDDMDGAVVNAIIDHSAAGYVYVQVTSTSADKSVVYKYNFGQAASTTEIVHVTLPTDNTHYVLKSAVFSNLADVESIVSQATAYYEGNADKIVLSPAAVVVTENLTGGSKVTSFSSVENIVSNPTVSVASPNTATVNYRGVSAGTCTVTATKTSVLTVGDTIGDVNVSWTDGSQESAIFTVEPGTSQTIKMSVASAGAQPWQGPVVMLKKADDSTVCATRVDDFILDDPGALKSSNWGGVSIASILNNSTAYITVANDGNGYACVRYSIIGNDTNTYYQYYDKIPVPAGSIKFNLKTDSCALTWM